MTSRTDTSARILALGSVAVAMLLAGCYSPKGGLIPRTPNAYTYYSTETQPKSVAVFDVRSDEPVFEMDIPAGKQLTFDFVEGAGDDVVYTPNLMRWEVFEIGTWTGRLANAQTVPPLNALRIEVAIREGYEYRSAPPDEPLRVDEVEDRPEWWTPEGGPLPEPGAPVTNYD